MSGPPGHDDRDSGVDRAAAAGPEIVVVGSASRDMAADDPRGWRLGGGVSYGALATARLGLRTAAVIGLDPPAFESPELDLLAQAGVELLRVALPHGPVFRSTETSHGRVQWCADPGGPLPAVGLPTAWRSARAWILAPVAGELDEAWADAIPAEAFVALGWQGLLRTLRAGEPVTRREPRPGRLVRRADLVSLSEHDVAPGTPLEDLGAFLRPGAQLVVTAGAAGGQWAEVTGAGLGRVARYPPVAAEHEMDATGAGDAFLAALVASLVRAAPGAARPGTPGGEKWSGAGLAGAGPVPDLRFAAADASLTVEGRGLSAVPDRPAVVRRLADRADRQDPGGQPDPESPSSSTYSAKAPR